MQNFRRRAHREGFIFLTLLFLLTLGLAGWGAHSLGAGLSHISLTMVLAIVAGVVLWRWLRKRPAADEEKTEI